MDKTELFKNLIKTLDKEIEAYQALKPLFEEKKEILKHAKSEDLGSVDAKIIAVNQVINKLVKSRKSIAYELGNENAVMSDFITIATDAVPDYVTKLEERHVKICKILEELALLNNQNMELLKHGIIITDKMLDTIVNAFAPQGSNYNGAGKTDSHDLDMWTINEEI